jgi:hypothetical protein
MAYNANHIVDLDETTPVGSVETGAILDDVAREIKRALKNDWESYLVYESITPATSITLDDDFPRIVLLPTTQNVKIDTITTSHPTDKPYVVDFLVTGDYTITFAITGNIKMAALTTRKNAAIRLLKYGSYWYKVG